MLGRSPPPLLAMPNCGGGGIPLAALAALVTLAALLLSSPPAIAQTSITLVSNAGQSNDIDTHFGNHDQAQAFTTGSNQYGYKLTEVRLELKVGSTPVWSNVSAKICSAATNSGGNITGPDTASCLAPSLTVPGTPVAGVNTFSAGGNGIDLRASTAYFLVLDSVITVTQVRSARTQSDAEVTAEPGWSIANNFYSRNVGSTGGWHTSSFVLMMAVVGYEKSAPPPATLDPSNLARGEVHWDPVGGKHGLPTRMAEIDSNKPSEPTGSLDLSNIAASVSEEREPHSRGYYLTTQVFGLGERSNLVRAGPDGSAYIEDEDGQRYEVVSAGSLLLVKIWHVYLRLERGTNSIELLGEAFYPRLDNRLTEAVEVCLPAPSLDPERVRIAVKGRLDPGWTVLDTTVKDGQVCAETVRVAWLVLVLAPEDEAA